MCSAPMAKRTGGGELTTEDTEDTKERRNLLREEEELPRWREGFLSEDAKALRDQGAERGQFVAGVRRPLRGEQALAHRVVGGDEFHHRRGRGVRDQIDELVERHAATQAEVMR